jgi:hypothetical protein
MASHQGQPQSRYREADAAVASLAETRAKVQSEYRRSLFDDLAKAEQKAGGLTQDVIKAEQRTKLQVLTAPVDGVVQQLAVHTVGGIVTPAQALAVVVPIDSHLEIEAMVSNRDIGFVLQAGIELAKHAVEMKPDLKVVYSTALTLTDRTKELLLPGSVILEKPYTVDELLTSLSEPRVRN